MSFISRKKFHRLLPLFISGAIIIILTIIPLGRGLYSQAGNPYSVLRNKLKVLNQIITYVNELYFNDVEIDELMEGAFDGIMKKLDPHSIYISAKKMENIDERFKGKFQGIGIEFDILNGYITVIAPVADSPSERVGLLPGDQIIEIDGKDAYGITKDEVFKTLRGRKGTSVNIKIARLGVKDPFEVTIIRDDIPLYSVRAAIMLDDITGYIWLTRFSATTSQEVRSALDRLESLGMERLLFDLRNNGGGYLEQAAEIANLFISERDTLVYTRGKRRDVEQVFVADPRKGRSDYPVIVLVNRGSASASEIVAGAIQDLDRGLIAGETTFGKGLVQRQIPLKDGSAIRVTIAQYYTPSGRLIQRPYKNGENLTYYKELYEKDREAKLDSLKELRPKFFTRSHRIVYGGGGITPDIYIPWESKMSQETSRLVFNPTRPIFNWTSVFASNNRIEFSDFESFQTDYKINDNDFNDFISYLNENNIKFDSTAIQIDNEYLLNNLKSNIASIVWGKDESMAIRMELDNQVNEAQKFFEEATDFVKK